MLVVTTEVPPFSTSILPAAPDFCTKLESAIPPLNWYSTISCPVTIKPAVNPSNLKPAVILVNASVLAAASVLPVKGPYFESTGFVVPTNILDDNSIPGRLILTIS